VVNAITNSNPLGHFAFHSQTAMKRSIKSKQLYVNINILMYSIVIKHYLNQLRDEHFKYMKRSTRLIANSKDFNADNNFISDGRRFQTSTLLRKMAMIICWRSEEVFL